MNRSTFVTVSILLLILIGASVYAYSHKTPPSSDISSAIWQTNASTSPLMLATTPSGDKQYTNAAFHFSLSYPSDLTVNQYNESGGALTVTFVTRDGTNGGFQIYVTPYSDTTITPVRFKLDEPSGVMQDQTAIVIDGTPATMFYGTNVAMGDSREVWFIHGGFLYEVTTYKQLDSWLAGIMQTWQFI